MQETINEVVITEMKGGPAVDVGVQKSDHNAREALVTSAITGTL